MFALVRMQKDQVINIAEKLENFLIIKGDKTFVQEITLPLLTMVVAVMVGGTVKRNLMSLLLKYLSF